MQKWSLFDFGLFLPRFGCHGNSLGFLEILDSLFEFPDPENPMIDAYDTRKGCVDILYTDEVIPIWMFGMYRQFSRFLRKIVEIVI